MAETQTDTSKQTALIATFEAGSALFGLDAAAVQEVIRVEAITPVRHAPPEIAGVINLRGKIVTLLDLARILGLGSTSISRKTRVFIVEDKGEFIGLLVDRAGEVFEVEPGHHSSIPASVPPAQARFYKAICRTGAHVVALLDTSAIVNDGRR